MDIRFVKPVNREPPTPPRFSILVRARRTGGVPSVRVKDGSYDTPPPKKKKTPAILFIERFMAAQRKEGYN